MCSFCFYLCILHKAQTSGPIREHTTHMCHQPDRGTSSAESNRGNTYLRVGLMRPNRYRERSIGYRCPISPTAAIELHNQTNVRNRLDLGERLESDKTNSKKNKTSKKNHKDDNERTKQSEYKSIFVNASRIPQMPMGDQRLESNSETQRSRDAQAPRCKEAEMQRDKKAKRQGSKET